jgi:hypothetical protein
MIFQNINQFEKAKKLLIENEGNIDLTLIILKGDKSFSSISESELTDALNKLNEGLGEKILNFLGSKLGGDISKLKDVLSKMKEQELKFNKEEFEIWNQFYVILQDQKALDKDKKNPNYTDLNRELAQSRNALNIRMKELTKMHDEIFTALEEKVKGLVQDSPRKKRYFNAQRADDVSVTKNDRYEKTKAITAKSSERSKDLQDFFGIDPEQAKRDAEIAKQEAENAAKKAAQQTPSFNKSSVTYTEEPEKTFYAKLNFISAAPGGFIHKRKELENLLDEIDQDAINSSMYSSGKKDDINKIKNEVQAYYDALESAYKKVK